MSFILITLFSLGSQRTQISHFYSRGNVCSQTRKPRQTEVKLKCLENASSPTQVSLYLLEPKICQYILGIESPLICEILDFADDNGLIQWPYGHQKLNNVVGETRTETNDKSEKEDETSYTDTDYKNDEL